MTEFRHKYFGALCEMLYAMEQDLGIARLPYHQKRILQAAAGQADAQLKFASSDVQEICARRYKMSRATYFRALNALKQADWVRDISDTESGAYRLNL